MSNILSIVIAWLISALPRILVHGAGVVVAIVLLRKARSRATVLALIAFIGLFLTDLANGAFQVLYPLVLLPRAGVRLLQTTSIVSILCCASLDAVAFVLLIIAFAQALTRPAGDEELT
ncbi:MAG: hypothetical protein PVI59_08425 [Anaerolineae bacterium]|jgi:hypothetical protein